MNPPFSHEFRCRRCGVLLGKHNAAVLEIQRSGMQVAIDGRFRVSIRCYGRNCQASNVLRLPFDEAGPGQRSAA